MSKISFLADKVYFCEKTNRMFVIFNLLICEKRAEVN